MSTLITFPQPNDELKSENMKEWQFLAPGSFKVKMVGSFDEMKANIGTNSLRFAVLTKEGLMVKTKKMEKIEGE